MGGGPVRIDKRKYLKSGTPFFRLKKETRAPPGAHASLLNSLAIRTRAVSMPSGHSFLEFFISLRTRTDFLSSYGA